MTPRTDPQPPTDFRGTAVTDIESALTDSYDLYETYTTPPNMTTRNEKVLSNFLYDNEDNMKYEREDITKMLKKYRVMQKKANDKQESEGVISRELQGVPVTPALVQNLITENAPAYNNEEEEVVERVATSEPLDSAARIKAWEKFTRGEISGRKIPSDFNSAGAIQEAFKAYIAARGVLYPEQNALWLGYFNTHKNKTFSKDSVDTYLKSQEIE